MLDVIQLRLAGDMRQHPVLLIALFWLILTWAFVFAQQPGSTPADAPGFDIGTVANGSYTNECLGFRFRSPRAGR